MTGIKPPHYIGLPRNQEKHFAHLQATELQAWLLYYAIPCLLRYLPAKYLQDFAGLLEGIYLRLGDNTTEGDLERAKTLLNTLYKAFSCLCGKGSCGLNVHNVGVHQVFMSDCGGLYVGSCFEFAD